ncbi:MAG: hypothetical protein ACRD2C_26995 [Acidimicrobiales bacterium]
MNFHTTFALAGQRRTEMLAEASEQRLAREARAVRPQRTRMTVTLSNLVHRVGRRTSPATRPAVALDSGS